MVHTEALYNGTTECGSYTHTLQANGENKMKINMKKPLYHIQSSGVQQQPIIWFGEIEKESNLIASVCVCVCELMTE